MTSPYYYNNAGYSLSLVFVVVEDDDIDFRFYIGLYIICIYILYTYIFRSLLDSVVLYVETDFSIELVRGKCGGVR